MDGRPPPPHAELGRALNTLNARLDTVRRRLYLKVQRYPDVASDPPGSGSGAVLREEWERGVETARRAVVLGCTDPEAAVRMLEAAIEDIETALDPGS